MSLCSQALWDTEFTEPMPEGTTYWDFVNKSERRWGGIDIKDQYALVRHLEAAQSDLNSKELSNYILEQKDVLGGLYVDKIKLETEGLEHDE